MNLVFVSDTHGDISSWKKIFQIIRAEDIDIIFHAGDVLYHGPRNPIKDSYSPSELAESINELSVPILIAKGNCDSEVDDMVLKPKIQPSPFFCQINKMRIVVHHGHEKSVDDLLQIANSFKAHLVVYGHSHVRKMFRLNDTYFINPGSTSLPKSEDAVPSFAFYDGKTIKLINNENGKTIKEMNIY